jgi:hypothetical protein
MYGGSFFSMSAKPCWQQLMRLGDIARLMGSFRRFP